MKWIYFTTAVFAGLAGFFESDLFVQVVMAALMIVAMVGFFGERNNERY